MSTFDLVDQLLRKYLFKDEAGEIAMKVYDTFGKAVYEKVLEEVKKHGKGFDVEGFVDGLFEGGETASGGVQQASKKVVTKVPQHIEKIDEDIAASTGLTKKQVKKAIGTFVIIALTHL